MGYRFYTSEEQAYLKEIAYGNTHQKVAEMFNSHFGVSTMNKHKVRSFLRRHNITNGRSGQFAKGNIPHNKGKKVILGQCKELPQLYKKGNIPHNKGKKMTYSKINPYWFKKGNPGCSRNQGRKQKPIGSELIRGNNFIYVKVAQPSVWIPKHNVIYESINGPIPEGSVVIFGDRDKRNFDPDNLILVTKQELNYLVAHKLLQHDAALSKSAILIADILIAINKCKKEKRQIKKV